MKIGRAALGDITMVLHLPFDTEVRKPWSGEERHHVIYTRRGRRKNEDREMIFRADHDSLREGRNEVHFYIEDDVPFPRG